MSGSSMEGAPTHRSAMGPAIPILRVFDAEAAKPFYLEFLGFGIDWSHRHDVDYPLYMQISRGDCLLHLSEHVGDATPGSGCFLPMAGVEAFRDELLARQYRNLRPELEVMAWGVQIRLTDPFGNKLTFCEQRASPA